MRPGKRPSDFGRDISVTGVLLACTLVSALTSPINPFPRDGWFDSQYRLFGNFPGEDNYSPISVPAVLYKLVHWLALLFKWDLKGELYLASAAQNVLLFLSACLVYVTCKCLSGARLASLVAIAFLLFVASTGLAQAFWSESVVLPMFAAVLYLSVKIYSEADNSSRAFWRRAFLCSLLIGLLVITRMTPIVLIPASCALLYQRLSKARIVGYTILCCLMTVLLLSAMALSNHVRFGRAELTNSVGRHSWEGVAPIADKALANSPEFLELKRINPDMSRPEARFRDWWILQMPNDSRQQFSGEALLGRLAREVIRNDPLNYLRHGMSKFLSSFDQPPLRLDTSSRGNVALLASDPLKTDRLLPPLGVAVFDMPNRTLEAAQEARMLMFALGRNAYHVMIFFLITTCGALIIRSQTQGRGSGASKVAAVLQFLFGVAVLCMIHAPPATGDWARISVTQAICAFILIVQVAIVYRTKGSESFRSDQPRGDGIVYVFLAMMFFGSLWLSWQVETYNPRNVVPYLPFLAVMAGMAISEWVPFKRA